MRRRYAIDVKILIIVILLIVIFFMAINRARNRGNMNFSTITAEMVRIITPKGNTVIGLSSQNEKAFIEIFNERGKRVAILAIVNEDGKLYLSTKEGEI